MTEPALAMTEPALAMTGEDDRRDRFDPRDDKNFYRDDNGASVPIPKDIANWLFSFATSHLSALYPQKTSLCFILNPMPPASAALHSLLRETALFSSLAQSELDALAADLTPVSLTEGELLFAPGDATDGLYLVEGGMVRVEPAEPAEPTRVYRRADLVGLEALHGEAKRNSTAQALSDAKLFFLGNKTIAAHLLSSNTFNQTFQLLMASRQLIRRVPMNWLQSDEEVRLMTRKHPFFLLTRALPPLILFLVLVFVVNLLVGVSSPAAMTLLILGFLLTILWLAWNINNWANDYYLITNKRMVWVERVSGLYDSRQEAPLSTLISVGVKTSQLGVFLGYSDVLVRTYIGDIRFEKIAHAKEIAHLIESFWARSKQVDLELDAKEIRAALRKQFGKDLTDISTQEMYTKAAEMEAAAPAPEISFWDWLFSDFFKVRFESGDTITYRKHWLVLLRNAFGAFLGLGLAAAFTISVVTRRITKIDYAMALVFGVFLIVLFLGVLVYVYLDWRNDMFQLTSNQVIDVDRKPLGKEYRRTAALENILSIEYERRGLLPMLFNFGTVYITVGNTQLTFDDVYQPSVVQQDIFNHMGRSSEEKQQRLTEQERERVSQWFRIFQEETQFREAAEDTTRPLKSPPA
jgi:hypothetical protein